MNAKAYLLKTIIGQSQAERDITNIWYSYLGMILVVHSKPYHVALLEMIQTGKQNTLTATALSFSDSFVLRQMSRDNDSV